MESKGFFLFKVIINVLAIKCRVIDGQIFAETFLYKPREQRFFLNQIIINVLVIFSLHLNTYVMGLLPL